ncbi:MAG TPA: AMP-binding protein, partial [Candidatus Dormibacteraeota bacterium]|nr:AMP-binding protein [Candidatus Dormibacteraeota bacterium]
VALLLYNCPEYIETMLGCFRARAVPFNVNQHYRPEEVRSLLDMLDAEADTACAWSAYGPRSAARPRGPRSACTGRWTTGRRCRHGASAATTSPRASAVVQPCRRKMPLPSRMTSAGCISSAAT